MAKFDAGSVVEPLEWTFEPFVPGAKGVVKEPNDAQITQYLRDIKAIAAEIKAKVPDAPDGNDPADLMSSLDDLDPEGIRELTGKMAGIVAALCSDDPSAETILALPPRRRTMFFGWLQQEVMSPEAAPGGGNAQVTTLRPAHAG
jgi:hypothetical protein